MKKFLISGFFALVSTICFSQIRYSAVIQTGKDVNSKYHQFDPGDNIITDLNWETQLVFGERNGSSFTSLNDNKEHEIIEEIQFFLNFNGNTRELTPKQYNCSDGISGNLDIPINLIKSEKLNSKFIVEQFVNGDIDNLQLIVKINYRQNRCPGGSSRPIYPLKDPEIFTIDFDNFGAKIIGVDIKDNEANVGGKFNQFITSLSYSSVGVATNFKTGISGLATTPAISFRSSNWFVNHIDLEYLVTTISTGANDSEDKVITGMGGCVGIFGKKSKGLKLGYYHNSELDKGYFVLAVSPSIFSGLAEFFKDMSAKPERYPK
ncbi:MAG: hypothetical protein RID18_09695 [Cytophagales bacterium]